MWELIIFVTCVVAANFKRDVVLTIVPTSDLQVKFLKTFIENEIVEMDIWRNIGRLEENVDIHFKAEDVETVKSILVAQNISFSYMVEDLQHVVDKEMLENRISGYSNSFDYNKYNTYDAIKGELYNIAARYHSKASIFTVGKSYEGQDMIGIKISIGRHGQHKPANWIDGATHAREWISPATVMYFMKYLLESRESRVKAALQKYDFYLLPVLNPDGYRFTHRGGRRRLWRKTTKPHNATKGRFYGADPNRNWDYEWGGEGSSSIPWSQVYRGPYPFSEIEVANVAGYLRNIPNLKSYWNVHSYGQILLAPWAYTTDQPRDYNEIMRVANVFVNKVRERYGTIYRAGPISTSLYKAAGNAIDWTYGKLGVIYSYSPELRADRKYGFILPADQIAPTGLETSEAIIAAVNSMK